MPSKINKTGQLKQWKQALPSNCWQWEKGWAPFQFVQSWLGALKGEWEAGRGSKPGSSGIRGGRGSKGRVSNGRPAVSASWQSWLGFHPLGDWEMGPSPSWWLHFKGMAFMSLRKTLWVVEEIHIHFKGTEEGFSYEPSLVNALKYGGQGLIIRCWPEKMVNSLSQPWAFPDRTRRWAGSFCECGFRCQWPYLGWCRGSDGVFMQRLRVFKEQ